MWKWRRPTSRTCRSAPSSTRADARLRPELTPASAQSGRPAPEPAASGDCWPVPWVGPGRVYDRRVAPAAPPGALCPGRQLRDASGRGEDRALPLGLPLPHRPDRADRLRLDPGLLARVAAPQPPGWL